MGDNWRAREHHSAERISGYIDPPEALESSDRYSMDEEGLDMFRRKRITKLTKGEAKTLLEELVDSRGNTPVKDTTLWWILEDTQAAELQEVVDRYRDALAKVDQAVAAFKAKEGSGSAIFKAYPPATEASLELASVIRSWTGRR